MSSHEDYPEIPPKYRDLKFNLINNKALRDLADCLDADCPITRNNWEEVADQFGYLRNQITAFRSRLAHQAAVASATFILFEEIIKTRPNTTVEEVLGIFKKIERPDAYGALYNALPAIYERSLNPASQEIPSSSEAIQHTEQCNSCHSSLNRTPSTGSQDGNEAKRARRHSPVQSPAVTSSETMYMEGGPHFELMDTDDQAVMSQYRNPMLSSVVENVNKNGNYNSTLGTFESFELSDLSDRWHQQQTIQQTIKQEPNACKQKPGCFKKEENQTFMQHCNRNRDQTNVPNASYANQDIFNRNESYPSMGSSEGSMQSGESLKFKTFPKSSMKVHQRPVIQFTQQVPPSQSEPRCYRPGQYVSYPNTRKTTVFITYLSLPPTSSPEHRNEELSYNRHHVKSLSHCLHQNAFGVHIDDTRDVSADSLRYFNKSHYVLVCISPSYWKIMEENTDPTQVRARFIYKNMRREYVLNNEVNERFIPVLFPGTNISDHIPYWLQDSLHYEWPQQYQDLFTFLWRPDRTMNNLISQHNLNQTHCVTSPEMVRTNHSLQMPSLSLPLQSQSSVDSSYSSVSSTPTTPCSPAATSTDVRKPEIHIHRH